MDKTILLASDLQMDSIVDGPGLRMVLWTQGCPHACPGCHNPQTHAYNGGELYFIDDICEEIKKSNLQTGLTLSGGDPFEQADKLLPIVKTAKEKGLDVLAYTGYYFEDLKKDKDKFTLLKELDLLIDGPFEIDNLDLQLLYKGSSNQRIIKVQESLEKGEIILYLP